MTVKEAAMILFKYLEDALMNVDHSGYDGGLDYDKKIEIAGAFDVFVSLEDRIRRLEEAMIDMESKGRYS